MSYSSQIAEALLDINAVKLSPQEPFTWSSGMKSPIYCDNRIALSYPKVRSLIIDGFEDKVKSLEVSGKLPSDLIVAGVATAGIPHGALLANRLNIPFIYVRSKPKAHGRQNQIEGELRPGAKVLVIEDLISTGGSSLEAVEALRQAGAQVVTVLAIFSYDFQVAVNNFEKANCSFFTLSTYQDLIEVAIRKAFITIEDQEMLMSWREHPRDWKPL